MERNSEVFHGWRRKTYKQKLQRENQNKFAEFFGKFSAAFEWFSTEIRKPIFRQNQPKNGCQHLLMFLLKTLLQNQILIKKAVDKP